MSRLGRAALIGTAVVATWALLAGGSYYVWQTWFAAADRGNGRQTAAVTRGDIDDSVMAMGTLQPRDYVDVGAQVSGQMTKLWVDIGDMVAAGQLLAEIDGALYQSRGDAGRAQLRNQRAQIADKQAQHALASLQFERQEKLANDNATTAEALQGAAAALQSARAQLDAFKAQRQQTESTLRGDEANLGYTRIYAPMAGTVVSQSARQGQILNANQQAPIIMRIADLATMTVQAQVPEAEVAKLRLGMEVYFTTPGGDNRRIHGSLRQIRPTPSVVDHAVLYDALVDVPNTHRHLMTRMTAQVFFVAANVKDAVLVPRAALRPAVAAGQTLAAGADPRGWFAGGRAFVIVIDKEGRATKREVKVGLMNCTSAQITAGLDPGEKVVVGNAGSAAPAQTPACAPAASNGAAAGALP